MNNRPAARHAGTLVLLGLCTLAPASDPGDPLGPAQVVAVDQALRQRFKHLDPFYKKAVDAGGLWILSSERVDERALLEARYLILSMLKGRKDVRQAMVSKHVRLGVMSHDEFTTDIPEHRRLSAWLNKRARGLGGNPVTCGEENLLNYRGDPYRGENILMHEFAHAIHHSGLRVLDKTFGAKLRAAFNKAKNSEQFAGYGMSSAGEFWAEAVQSWFACNTAGLVRKRDKGGKRKPLLNRADLKAHLPEIARLLAEAFGDNDWLYTTTDRRLDMPHLKGYDRNKAPSFKWPKHVIEAARAARAEEQKRRARKKK